MPATFEGQIVFNSPAAVRFEGVYWEGPLWFPRSQIEIIPDNMDTGSVVIKVKDWLINKRGLLEFTHYSLKEIEAMDAE